ncbi:hypothetical protein HanXRQr2_Chr17g0790481 [Helianthus annuus]|uniref:Uncharacterized protein n=1 Tax=Helianthus annuus TaxID=4232 RepID=A0A9K3GTM0_HELAN|nr:hypothetical protein HanXRQr2_Chr17g0790481 [Helianthus annuus]
MDIRSFNKKWQTSQKLNSRLLISPEKIICRGRHMLSDISSQWVFWKR